LAVKQYAIYKTGHRVVFIKLGPKHASKDEIELIVFKVFREFLLVVSGSQAPEHSTRV
jgi:hypothetical protein